MKKTYCGKDCDTCTIKQKINCPECKNGMEHTLNHHCEIADCCREKKLNECSSCISRDICCLRQEGQKKIPQTLLRLHNESVQDEADLIDSARFFENWIKKLFWVLISMLIVSNCNLTIFQEKVPFLYRSLQAVYFVLAIFDVYILFKMSQQKKDFRLVAFVRFAAYLFTAANIFLFENTIFSVVPIMVSVIFYYSFFNACSKLLSPYDHTLSEKWLKLWKWCRIALEIVCICFVLSFFLPVLSIFILFISAFIILAVNLLEYVYLYKSATAFHLYLQENSGKETDIHF